MSKPDDQPNLWPNFYTFYTIKGVRPLHIPKKDVTTWSDLLSQLEDQTNFKMDRIDVARNNVRVYYDPSTKLIDIGIKKDDILIALLKPTLKHEQQREDYAELEKEGLQRCMREVRERLEDKDNERLEESIKGHKRYQELYQKFINEFDKIEVMIAISQCQGNQQQVQNFLRCGKTASIIQEKQKKKEKQYLKKFLQTQEMKTLKTWIREHKVDENGYKAIMQKLYKQDPKFRKLEHRHSNYVQKALTGTLFHKDSDQQDDEFFNDEIQELVQRAQADKRRELSQEDKKQFFNRMEKSNSKQQINSALSHAANNLEKAEFLLKHEIIENEEKLVNALKRTARINIVLQFFNRPEFSDIRSKLKGNPKKTQKFVEYAIKTQEGNKTLVKLIERYKQHVVTLLSEEYSFSKPEKLDKVELNFEKQVTHDYQVNMSRDVNAVTDQRLVNALIKAKVPEPLANSAVRAAQNKQQEIYKYLMAGGINQTFDFCPNDPKIEQLFLYKKWKDEKATLEELKDQKKFFQWLSALSAVRPTMFNLIIKNRPFFDRIIKGTARK